MTTAAASKNRHVSHKASLFTESVIREMTREALKHGAVNLSQGFPISRRRKTSSTWRCRPSPTTSISSAITWGARDFREAIARKTKWYLGLDVDPETEIDGHLRFNRRNDRGDDGHRRSGRERSSSSNRSMKTTRPTRSFPTPSRVMCRCAAPDWSFDRDELRLPSTPRPEAIIVCNPNNPTGKVFTRAEMEFIAGLVPGSLTRSALPTRSTNTFFTRAKAPEIQHISMAQIEGMRERTVIVNSMSKTYSGDRLARGLLHRTRRDHERDSQGSRLSDCRRRAAPCRQPALYALALAARILRQAASRLSRRAAICSCRSSRMAGFRTFQPGRRLLHHDRHQRFWFRGRRRIHPAPDSRGGSRLRAGLELLQRS